MLNSNFNFKNHILPDFSITLEILENFEFVLCLFWLVNYERHWYLLSFTIVDKHFFLIWLFLGILALFLNLKTTGKIWFDINKNKFYHSKPTVSEKSLKLPLQSFLLLACSGKICLIYHFLCKKWLCNIIKDCFCQLKSGHGSQMFFFVEGEKRVLDGHLCIYLLHTTVF